MKLLIITQAVGTEDPVLGFFVRWIEEFAKHVERVEVICLKEGKHTLPVNVRVHSLGKENGVSRVKYILNFYKHIWQLRHEYDAVFVHMNQEYILIAGWLWKLLGKRMYLWRNHYAGSLLTDIAAAFCTKVFCTSRCSFTAKYKKTVLMPVGLDTRQFFPDARVVRRPYSILFLARMAPSKRPEMLIDALTLLARDGIKFFADFYGSPLPKDEAYYEELKKKVRSLGLSDYISFHPGVPNSKTPDLYRAHEIFVNTSPSGMLDKTIFEATACGCLPLATSADWAEQAGEEFSCSDSATLAYRLAALLLLSPGKVATRARALHERVVDTNTLSHLGEALEKAMR